MRHWESWLRPSRHQRRRPPVRISTVTWSVLIVTQKGTCDRAYRYPVKIEKGSVGYAGDASFTVSGKVGENGAVTVRVARGSQSANGQGKLGSTDGSGQWVAGSGDCSGTWTAERRSS